MAMQQSDSIYPYKNLTLFAQSILLAIDILKIYGSNWTLDIDQKKLLSDLSNLKDDVVVADYLEKIQQYHPKIQLNESYYRWGWVTEDIHNYLKIYPDLTANFQAMTLDMDHWRSLPSDIIFQILNYLTLKELSQVAMSTQFFRLLITLYRNSSGYTSHCTNDGHYALHPQKVETIVDTQLTFIPIVNTHCNLGYSKDKFLVIKPLLNKSQGNPYIYSKNTKAIAFLRPEEMVCQNDGLEMISIHEDKLETVQQINNQSYDKRYLQTLTTDEFIASTSSSTLTIWHRSPTGFALLQELTTHKKEIKSILVLNKDEFISQDNAEIIYWKRNGAGLFDQIQTFATNMWFYELVKLSEVEFAENTQLNIIIRRKNDHGLFEEVQSFVSSPAGKCHLVLRSSGFIVGFFDPRFYGKKKDGQYVAIQSFDKANTTIFSGFVELRSNAVASVASDQYLRIWRKDQQSVYQKTHSIPLESGQAYEVTSSPTGDIICAGRKVLTSYFFPSLIEVLRKCNRRNKSPEELLDKIRKAIMFNNSNQPKQWLLSENNPTITVCGEIIHIHPTMREILDCINVVSIKTKNLPVNEKTQIYLGAIATIKGILKEAPDNLSKEITASYRLWLREITGFEVTMRTTISLDETVNNNILEKK